MPDKLRNRRRYRGGVILTTGTGMIFVLPALILFSVFIAYPLLTALSYSLFNWSGIVRGEFTGLANYLTLITDKPYNTEIPNAFGHNLLLFGGEMLFQNSIGLLLAVLLHRISRFKQFFQTLYSMPYLVSPLVIGYLWSLMLSPLFGPINATLKAIGLGDFAQPWLGNPDTAVWMVVFVTAWQWIGFPVLLYGAALGGIPTEITEAAEIDGAGSWKRFWHVTFPLLIPAIGTVSVLTFIGSMESFPIPYALGGSQGNPAGATDVMSLLFYRTAFESGSSNSIGISSAVATCLFLFIFGVSMLIATAMRRTERKIF